MLEKSKSVRERKKRVAEESKIFMGEVQSAFQVTLTQCIILASSGFSCAKLALGELQPVPLLWSSVAPEKDGVM